MMVFALGTWIQDQPGQTWFNTTTRQTYHGAYPPSVNTFTPTFTPTATPVDYIFQTSATAVPTQTNSYVLMSGNSVTLTAGTWELGGVVGSGSTVAAVTIVSLSYSWSTVNGDNTGTVPATVVTGGNITYKGGVVFPTYSTNGSFISPGNTTANAFQTVVPELRIALSATTTIFLDAFVNYLGARGNVQMQTSIWASRRSFITN